MGAGGEDIQLSPKARELFPFSIECKNTERAKQLYDWYEQASYNAKKNLPVVVVKKNREKPLAIIDFDLFLALSVLIHITEKGEADARN